jgi:8-oxo-dGTP pyrophosphatase MutT (NUDIX family)
VTRHGIVTGALVAGGRVLLVHRHPDRRAYPDVWDLPGGHVEPGESALEALGRELREELDVRVVPDSARRLGALHACPGDEEVHVDVWFVGEWHGQPANAAPEEHDRIGWFRTEELDTLEVAHDGLAALLAGIQRATTPLTDSEA